MDDIIAQWEAGELPDSTAAALLWQRVNELQREAAVIDAAVQRARRVLSLIASRAPHERLAVADLGELVLTAPSQRIVADGRRISAALASVDHTLVLAAVELLARSGDDPVLVIASRALDTLRISQAAVAAALTISVRAGSLRLSAARGTSDEITAPAPPDAA